MHTQFTFSVGKGNRDITLTLFRGALNLLVQRSKFMVAHVFLLTIGSKILPLGKINLMWRRSIFPSAGKESM